MHGSQLKIDYFLILRDEHFVD